MAPEVGVGDLVESYGQDEAAYSRPEFNELQARKEFIDPLLERLGWDVGNQKKFSQNFKDVLLGGSLKTGEGTKAPDYTIRVGGNRAFFVEAKKPAVNIQTDPEPAYQLRRYGWSAKLPLSVLTNFRQFAIYDCRFRPSIHDRPAVARIHYNEFREYPENWAKLSGYLSKDAVQKGSIERFAGETRTRKGETTVDTEFLKDIEGWRGRLARVLALRNPKLDPGQMNFVVQQTIDRIVFLRICEDRGVEPEGQLKKITRSGRIYEKLFRIFERADEKYNSGLFHFSREKDRVEPSDEVSSSLKIDDETLRQIIDGLYYPQSPFEFSVIPAEILGQVYEQFLGRVIRLTPSHRAVVEEKPEVRKAGGVYYTPTYVVEFLVNRAIDPLLEGKTPQEALSLRIVDPACGSGSFLIAAYERLLRWHLEWYHLHPGKGPRESVHSDSDGTVHLSLSERKRILQSCIFGVDIDSQAVEVTKLSLHLRVLEGQTEETLGGQLRLYHDRALPDLGHNIRQGNAIIAPDILGLDRFDPGQVVAQSKPFDWNEEFPFLRDGVRFDVVVGNPPWGADLTEAEREYLRKKNSRVVRRIPDSYLFFLDKSLLLAGKSGSRVGLVLPSTVLNQHDAMPARDLMLDSGLDCAVNLGPGVFGRKVLNTTTLVSCSPGRENRDIELGDFSLSPQSEKSRALAHLNRARREEWVGIVMSDPEHTYFLGNLRAATLLQKARAANRPLSELIDGEIQRGISPDYLAAHVVSRETARKERLESSCLRLGVSGVQIKAYHRPIPDQAILYLGREDDIELYPMAREYIARYRDSNTCPEVKQRKHPWWSLHRKRNPGIFESPKFIGLTTSKTIELAFDATGSFVVTDALYVFRTRPGFQPDLVLSVMQSEPFLFFYRVANQNESRVIPQIKAAKLETIPFPTSVVGTETEAELVRLSQRAYELTSAMGDAESERAKEDLRNGLSALRTQIDNLCYHAYKLTADDTEFIHNWIANETGPGGDPSATTTPE